MELSRNQQGVPESYDTIRQEWENNIVEGQGSEKFTGFVFDSTNVTTDLMTRDEISVMDGGKCILQLRGVRSFFSDKYDLTKHPNFKLTADYDKKYTFDIEKYLNRRMKLKADDVYDVIEI